MHNNMTIGIAAAYVRVRVTGGLGVLSWVRVRVCCEGGQGRGHGGQVEGRVALVGIS